MSKPAPTSKLPALLRRGDGRCGVNIAELRAVPTRVPLLFAAPGAGKAAGA